MRKRLFIGLGAAAVIAVALLLGGTLSSAGERDEAAPAGVPLEAAFGGAGFRGSEAAVESLQAQLRKTPGDGRSYALLGLAYQQRARETGDPTFYAKAGGALARARKLDPKSDVAVGGLAALALSRHEFASALELGREARRLAPYTARYHGVVGDALLELGRYREAFAAYERMNALKPGVAAYARVSHARELLGRRAAAIRAMRLAVDAAASQPEPAAWAGVQLAKLYFGQGDLARARAEYRRALRVFPGYLYALDGLARVEAAAGRQTRAVELASRAAEVVPLPEFVTTLGDLYGASGKRALAREQYALVGATEQLLRANGVRTDLEGAYFDVDHGVKLRSALGRARAAWRSRRSIAADDTLAWALARNGRCPEARNYSQRSLRLGTRDAAFFFHRGMIERCLGKPAAARVWFRRAVDLNPHFSPLWGPVAQQLAA